MAGRLQASVVMLAGVFLSGAMLSPGLMHAGAGGGQPGFGEPTPSGIVGDGFEQDLRVDTSSPGHEIDYSAAPVGLGSSSVVWRSTDSGKTFKYIPSQIPPYGKPIACVGGGDAELAVDSAGHLYFADLYLANFAVGRSDDHGRSWVTATNCAGVPDSPVDRQWYTTIGDPTTDASNTGLFLVYDETPGSGAAAPMACPANVGNILTITRSPGYLQTGAQAGANFSPAKALSCDEGIMGNDVSFTYPGTGAASGPKVFVIHDNAALNDISVDRCAVGAESVTNPQGLTCTSDIVVASFLHAKTGANFPTISVDDHGNLFAVWEEAPKDNSGNITGNTQLFFSTSSNEGTTWSAPQHLPTPGLNQTVMAWPGSGDPGRIDVAFYGTPAPWSSGDVNGPDSVTGRYSLYMVQTLDNGAHWSAPILASEHFIHYGTMQTLIGGQSGNRGLGDFLQLRIGPHGEAEISYADTNLFEGNADLSPEAMYVRQNSGSSVYSNVGTVSGSLPPPGNCASDAPRDATFDANGTVGPDEPNLDILQACMTQPDATHYRITMRVSDLTSLGPDPTAGGTVNIWQMQWHVPSATDTTNGGALFDAYMESDNGGAPTCWVGQNSQQEAPGGAELTYPGSTQLPAADCTYTATAPGTITITVPTSDVFEPGAISSTLYSVAASTQTVEPPNAETPPNTNTQALGVVGGQLPNLIDVAPAFDFNESPINTPEAPWAPVLVISGTAVLASTVWVRRRRSAGVAA